MPPEFVLSPSVSFQKIDEDQYLVRNGADLQLPLSGAMCRLLECFRTPIDPATLGLEPSQVEQLVGQMQQRLILLPVERSANEEMRMVWNYLAQGDAARAIHYIDNESASLEEFADSGREALIAIRNLVDLDEHFRVVTIGCGMGRIEHALAPEVAEVTAFDISPAMIQRAETYLVDRPNVRLHVTDGRLLEAGDGSADLVMSFLVFQHADRDAVQTYFTEAHRVLGAGGRFFFHVHCYPDDSADIQTASLVDRYYGDGKIRVSEAEVARGLEDAGFVVEWSRESLSEGPERRLGGTQGPWTNMLFCARPAPPAT